MPSWAAVAAGSSAAFAQGGELCWELVPGKAAAAGQPQQGELMPLHGAVQGCEQAWSSLRCLGLHCHSVQISGVGAQSLFEE